MLHTFIPLFVCTLHIPTIQCELERSKLNSRAVYMDRHTMKTDVCLLMSTIAWTMQIIVQSKRTNNVADPVQWAQWSPHTDTHTHTSIERENRNKQIDHHLLFWRAPFPQTRNEREKNAMEKRFHLSAQMANSENQRSCYRTACEKCDFSFGKLQSSTGRPFD